MDQPPLIVGNVFAKFITLRFNLSIFEVLWLGLMRLARDARHC